MHFIFGNMAATTQTGSYQGIIILVNDIYVILVNDIYVIYQKLYL